MQLTFQILYSMSLLAEFGLPINALIAMLTGFLDETSSLSGQKKTH